jgi:hypothetical protein
MWLAIALALMAGVTEAATDATLSVSGDQWGISTEHIGAGEGDGRFEVSDFADSGLNTFRIYCDVSRFEWADDDGVYGSPSIAEIKADPDEVPWSVWDERMDDPIYPWTALTVTKRDVFGDLHDAGIRTVIVLRNRDTHDEPKWIAAVPSTDEDWNEWWAYCFAMAYWLNVRNDYGVDDYEVLNEPDITSQGWTGTLEQYYEMVRKMRDAIDHVYTTYLPGRTYRIHAPVIAWRHNWVTGCLANVGDEFEILNVHSYALNLQGFIRDMHGYLDAYGYSDRPLWISEWGTYWSSYDAMDMALKLVSNLIRGSRPGQDYVYGSHIFSMYNWGEWFDGLVRTGGDRARSYYAVRLAARALQGGRPTFQSTASTSDLMAITTRDPSGKLNLLVANNSSDTAYSVTANLLAHLSEAGGTVWQFSSDTMDECVGHSDAVGGASVFEVPAKAAVLVEYYPYPLLNPDNGHQYELVAVPGGITWQEAREAAESQSFTNGGVTYRGYLATITSEEESDFLRDLPRTGPPGAGFWLGGYQGPGGAEPAGGWQWVTAEPFNYSNWLPQEPNDGAPEEDEDRLHFTNLTEQWNDLPGAERIEGYVVEFGEPNQPPVADAGGPYQAVTDEVVVDVDPNTLNLKAKKRWVTAYVTVDADGTANAALDGRGSTDPNGDDLTYGWTVRDGEGTQVAAASGAQAAVELPVGTYSVELIVSDGELDSEPDTTTLSVELLELDSVDHDSVWLCGPTGWPETYCERARMQAGGILMMKFNCAELSGSLLPDQPNQVTVGGALCGEDTIDVLSSGNYRRERTLFDDGWTFHRGEAEGAEEPSFDDSSWRPLDLPHDWSIEDLPDPSFDGPFNPDAIGGRATGYTVGGVGWYRKSFSLPERYEGRTLHIQFDGHGLRRSERPRRAGGQHRPQHALVLGLGHLPARLADGDQPGARRTLGHLCHHARCGRRLGHRPRAHHRPERDGRGATGHPQDENPH